MSSIASNQQLEVHFTKETFHQRWNHIC